jgi:hypothetical protein
MSEIFRLEWTVKGEPVVKKNTKRIVANHKDRRTGQMIPNKKIAIYYTDAWSNWDKEAVLTLSNLITKHPEIEFPLTGKYNLQCLFYYTSEIVVDLSNLYEGIQDVMAGKSETNVPKRLFQIIFDDSHRFIGSHNGSGVFLDPLNPRSEFILTDYKMSKRD